MSLAIFEILKERVLPTLQAYQNDLLVHDKNALAEYDGPFVYGWRKTGTDLIRLLPKYTDIKWRHQFEFEETEKLLRQEISWITYSAGCDRNHWFLYYDGKNLHVKTVQELEKIYDDHITKIINEHKQKQEVY